MHTVHTDVVIVGGGGAGLRAALAIATSDATLSVALVSKVVPMRSHTVAAEGGAAGVVGDADSFDAHFRDTVVGGDWLCDQDAVDLFVKRCPDEMVQLEHWGCPWSRRDDGHVEVRNFGGMSVARTWFAADKTGFHLLHTLFQTSLQYPTIRRFDEFFVLDLLVEDGCCRGVVAIEIATGEFFCFIAGAVIMATGGAGRVFQQNTNAGIVTGDGMGMAFAQGVALRDMEFVQYHPTTLPGSGLLITEGCRGEGGFLTNANGHRYLQDYGLGPEVSEPTPKTMELGPRDRLSQAFWHEQRAARTVSTPQGQAVNLELMHLGRRKLHERLPLIVELSQTFLGIDATTTPIPVCPSVHYTMGGIATDVNTVTALPGLFACGECASVGIHGANRLGSNSLAELFVFGAVAGEHAARYVREPLPTDDASLLRQARECAARADALLERCDGKHRVAPLRNAMCDAMQEGIGIFRKSDDMSTTCATLDELVERYADVALQDHSRVFNTEWLAALELRFSLHVARAIACAALAREESRGAHQRLDAFDTRDDAKFLKHSLVHYAEGAAPQVEYADVNITRLPPGERHYGAAAGRQQTATAEHSNG